MLKHWSDLKMPKDKPYLVLGSGPSFSRIGDLQLDKYHVVCTSFTIKVVPKCLLWFPMDDWHIFGSEDIYNVKTQHNKAEYIFTRIINTQRADEFPNCCIIEYDGDLEVLNRKSLWDGKRVLPRSASTDCIGLLFKHWDIREVYTLGIDGGVGTSHLLNEYDVVNPPNFDYSGHNHGFFTYLCEYGAKVQKL